MEMIVLVLFILGYLFITLEHSIKVNKASLALLTGVLCWSVYMVGSVDVTVVSHSLLEHLSEISGILFFLMGAMTIVELVDAHDGFDVITSRINTNNKHTLLWIISVLAFLLSAVLDNLTTAIVMVSLLRKFLDDKEDRWLFSGMVIIAANAGGAWSPIGDVTTTMLWIGGQITAVNIILKLILPSLVCLLVPLLLLSFNMKGSFVRPVIEKASNSMNSLFERNVVFYLALAALVFVPVFKTITHLPPFMGVMFGLAILWLVTELIHKNKNIEEKDTLSVARALQKIDVPSILFFLGILLAVAALQSVGHLHNLSTFMNEKIGNESIIVLIIGLFSAVIDNVPLVAATMGMYDLSVYPPDSFIWEFLAFCSGTGGSVLIIGSAAGVAVMGLEKIAFGWYVKKISWLALLGYFAGSIVYLLLN